MGGGNQNGYISGTKCRIGLKLRINQGPVWDLLGYPEATLRPQVQMSPSINLNLSISQFHNHILFSKYLSPLIWHRNGSVFNIHRWISVSRREKTFYNSIAWFTSYSNFCDTGEFRHFFLNTLYY